MIRILQIDDNKDDAELIKLCLSRLSEDLELQWVDKAEVALQHLKANNYDCIVCDYQMPGMNGLDLLKAIRKEGNPTPFIFLTGQGNEEIAAQALRQGADEYYTKELGFANYHRLVNSIVNLVDAKIEREARKDSDKKIRQMSETISDVIVTHDLDGKINYFNQALVNISGYRESDLENLNIVNILPESYSRLKQLQETRAKEHVYIYETYLITATGTGIPVEINSTYIESSISGSEIIIIARDTTERKKAEVRIKKSEQFFRKLFEFIPVAILLLDDHGTIIDCSDTALKLFQCEKNDLVNSVISELKEFAPIDRQLFTSFFNTIDHEEGISSETIISRQGNSRLYVDLTMVKTKIAGSTNVLVSIIDNTDQMINKHALEESETKYRKLFEAANDAIFLMKDYRFTDCHNRTLEMFGCERDEIIGFTPDQFSPAKQEDGSESAGKAKDKIDKAMNGEPQVFHWRHMRKNGE